MRLDITSVKYKHCKLDIGTKCYVLLQSTPKALLQFTPKQFILVSSESISLIRQRRQLANKSSRSTGTLGRRLCLLSFLCPLLGILCHEFGIHEFATSRTSIRRNKSPIIRARIRGNPPITRSPRNPGGARRFTVGDGIFPGGIFPPPPAVGLRLPRTNNRTCVV